MELSLIITAGLVVLTLFLLVAIGMNIKKVYKVPKANEILVRTGGRETVVSKGGGLVKLPWIHEIARISAEAVTISIDRGGAQALRTGNFLLANVQGSMLVQVDPENPETAAQALGSAGPSELEEAVRKVADSIVDDAMRTAARKKTFDELNIEKDKIAEEVRKSVGSDLSKLGIKLLAVTITDVKQQPFDENDNSVDTARGRQVEAEITQLAAQETNRIEQEAKVAIQTQDVDAREAELVQDLRQAKVQADTKRQVDEYEAKQKADTRTAVLEQEQIEALAEAAQKREIAQKRADEARLTEEAGIAKTEAVAVRQAQADAAQTIAEEEASQKKEAAVIARNKTVETARIAKQKEVEAATIEKDQAISVADIARNKAVETARIAKEQEVETAAIEKDRVTKVGGEVRQQAVEEAEVTRQVAVAEKRAEEATARAAQAVAEAEQKTAEEAIVTVTETAQANRARQVVEIKAQEQSKKDEIAADRDAYVETKKAEAEATTAAKLAEAAKSQAQGVADALTTKATGEAEAVKAKAQGYADDVSIRAKADSEAADMQAAAKIKLAGAALKEGEAEAQARQLMVEAENKVGMTVVLRDLAVQAITADLIPKTVNAVMEPIGLIGKDIKILQVNGLGGGEDEVGGLPAQILNVGLAAAGVTPFLHAATAAVAENPDVKALTESLGSIAKGAIREAAAGVREGLQDNGVTAEAK